MSVTVSMEMCGEPITGLWCEKHALPCRVAAAFLVWVGDGPVSLLVFEGCAG